MNHLVINDVVNQIRQEIDVDIQGRGKASIRATARLAGIDDKSLRAAFTSAEQSPSPLATKLIEYGFDAAEQSSWSHLGIPDLAVSIVLEYYAFDAGRHSKEQAKSAYKAFASIGIRTWMQRIKGWQEVQTQSREDISLQQPSVKDISEAISSVFCMGTVDQSILILFKV
jgi:hypothetical protein